MDALILAGGATPPELATGLDVQALSPDRALVQINGRPMLDYVLDALHNCQSLQRIAVVGTPQVLSHLQSVAPAVLGVPDQGKMMANAVAGLQALRREPNASRLCLITTTDIPLVSGATYDELLRGFQAKGLEAAYALTTRKICEAAYPGGKRTYARLTDGDYTAGNAVIVEGHIIERLADVFEKFYKARKNPLAMAKIIGAGFLWRTVTKKLSVQDAEAKLSEITGVRAGAVLMHDASIAFDVDKIEDYRLVAAELARSTQST
ncbi:MAG: hypothetical protein JWN98_1400 [Abditibacteriota bacterium]|nr:hypothetical protein [Abditibacteriota bacterium]